MRRLEMNIPQFGMIVGTRAMIGVGLGLLLADRIGREKRSAIGWTLLTVGALSTLPLLAQILHKEDSEEPKRFGRHDRSRTQEQVPAV